jgi:hypothetical protein
MFVQRERERQYHKAPSLDKCRRGLVQTDMRAYECCIDAIEALTLITKELQRVLKWRDLPIASLVSDAADLLLLTNYLLRWPLEKAVDYFDFRLDQLSNAGQATDDSSQAAITDQADRDQAARDQAARDQAARDKANRDKANRDKVRDWRQRHERYRKKWISLAFLIRAIEEHLSTLSKISPIRERLSQFEDAKGEDPTSIPSLGAVELLLRVVAEAKESRHIGT